MKILIIGGTGAMGSPLAKYLSEDKNNSVYIVSRHDHFSRESNVFYVTGDINSEAFFHELIRKKFDVIIDFMIWAPALLKKRLKHIFDNCGQYIAMGTSSEYAGVDGLITEETPRLYDTYSPEERRQGGRYHIKKSKDDDLITASEHGSWTIIRPWVTYNARKNPLVTVPLSVWMWRYLHDRTIFLPRQVMDKKCSLTYGEDAARAIKAMVGNPKAYGQIVNIASNKWMTWAEAVETYQDVLFELRGKVMKLYLLPDASVIWRDIPSQYDPIAHDRCFDRCFSTEKLNELCGEEFVFGDLRECLKMSLEKTLNDPTVKLGAPSAAYQGLMDRLAGEHTPLSMIPKASRKSYKIALSPTKSWAKRVYRSIKGEDLHIHEAQNKGSPLPEQEEEGEHK